MILYDDIDLIFAKELLCKSVPRRIIKTNYMIPWVIAVQIYVIYWLFKDPLRFQLSLLFEYLSCAYQFAFVNPKTTRPNANVKTAASIPIICTHSTQTPNNDQNTKAYQIFNLLTKEKKKSDASI